MRPSDSRSATRDASSQREPAIAHVREHVDILDVRQKPDAARGPDVGNDAARQGEPPMAGQPDGVAGKRHAGALDDALSQIGELLIRVPPVDLRQRASRAVPGTRRGEDAIAHLNPGQERIVVIGDRRGIVSQRHDLALVLELPHVQQAGHVLEKHAERAARARSGDSPQLAVAERRDRG